MPDLLLQVHTRNEGVSDAFPPTICVDYSEVEKGSITVRDTNGEYIGTFDLRTLKSCFTRTGDSFSLCVKESRG